MQVEDFLQHITNSVDYGEQIVRVERLGAREAQFGELSEPLSPPVREMLAQRGIDRLYTHQVDAVEAVRRGESVAVVTSTASGKTLCYNIPVIERLLAAPASRAIYLFPTKALAQDQLRGLEKFVVGCEQLELKAGTYDGDTPTSLRRSLRDEGNVILTNPDMLHCGILPNHSRWAPFFERLGFVVIDEIHTYRGIFGSNVANVIRRLRRICRHYGTEPIFILASATIGNPAEHAEKLIAQPVTLIDNDGAPRGPKSFVLWNPPYIDDSRMARRSPNIEAQRLMTSLIADENVQTITFARARVTAELLYRYVQDALRERDPRLAETIRPYRGGYLPEDRRAIERLLFEGELMGVTCTNALELGIDIGSLDASLIVGYPGSIASTWQEAGRAGRGSEESLAVLIAANRPIDQYLMHHPEYFFGQNPERAVVDSDNPFILYRHLRCALQELPLTGADGELFGENTGGIIEILAEEGQTREVKGAWYWTGPSAPAIDVNLRNTDDNNYVIQDLSNENQVIGQIDEWGAFSMLHNEAIYLHGGQTYMVEELNLAQRIAYVRSGDFDYYTMAVDRTDIRLLDVPEEPPIEKSWRISPVGYGPVEVTSLVYMFRKIKFYQQDSIGFGNLDLPAQTLDTMAMWIIPPREVLRRIRSFHRDPAEALLGVANALAGVLGLYVICESSDVGTTIDTSNLLSPAIFIYDRYPGGLGFARRCYDLVEDIFAATLQLIEECPCQQGCPSCVGSPLPRFQPSAEDIDTRGQVPDKEAARCLLHDMLQREPYQPPVPAGYAEAAQPVAAAADTGAVSGPPLEIKPLPEYVARKIRSQIHDLQQRRRHQ